MSTKTALIVDGYAYIFRSFYSVPSLKTKLGVEVNAVFGFFNHIIGLILNLNPDYVFIALDSKESGFRDEIFEAYKANRPSCPVELKHQFDIIKTGIESCGLKVVQKHGVEADDMIASLAFFVESKNIKGIICSKDKDLMQLIKDDKIEFYDDKQKTFIKEADVMCKFGVPPKYISDYLALVGDSADNIPGAKNIGPKKAATIITAHGSIENIYNNIHLLSEDVKKLLEDSKENVLMSKRLTSLMQQADIIEDIEFANLSGLNLDGGSEFFKSLGMASVKTRFTNLVASLNPVTQVQKTPILQSAAMQDELFPL